MSRHRIRFALEATPAAVCAARHRISAAVRMWDVPSDEEVRFHQELVATGLLTHAIRHAYGPLSLGVALEDGLVVIEVVDGSTEVPRPRAAESDDEGGRGLTLIDALRLLHGSESLPAVKRCWAVLPVRPAAAHPTPDAAGVDVAAGGAAYDSARWSPTRAGDRLLLRMLAAGA